MTVYTTDTHKHYRVTLKKWNNKTQQYSSDLFDDFEDYAEKPYIRDWDAHMMTEEDFQSSVSWWKDEIKRFERGEISEAFGDLTEAYEDGKIPEQLEEEMLISYEDIGDGEAIYADIQSGDVDIIAPAR